MNPLGKLATKLQLDRPMQRTKVSILEPPTLLPTPEQPAGRPTFTIELREQITFDGGFFLSDSAIETDLMPLLTPAEYMVYRALWFESYGGKGGTQSRRSYCRISQEGLLRATSIRSRTSIKEALKGLAAKHCVIRIGPPEQVEPSGTVYRVLRPHEVRTGVLDDGVRVQDLSDCIVEGEVVVLEKGHSGKGSSRVENGEKGVKNWSDTKSDRPENNRAASASAPWSVSGSQADRPEIGTPSLAKVPLLNTSSLVKRESEKRREEKGGTNIEKSSEEWLRHFYQVIHGFVPSIIPSAEMKLFTMEKPESGIYSLLEELCLEQLRVRKNLAPGLKLVQELLPVAQAKLTAMQSAESRCAPVNSPRRAEERGLRNAHDAANDASGSQLEQVKEALKADLFRRHPAARNWASETLDKTLDRLARRSLGQEA